MSFWREEEGADKLPQNWRQRSDKGVPRGQNDSPTRPEGTTNWSDTSSRPPAKYDTKRDNQHPGHPLDVGEVEDAAGSAKVIPENGDMDFENKRDRTHRIAREKQAIRMQDVERYTQDIIRQRSQEYRPLLKRVDKKNLMWTFQVGKWQVRVKAKFPPRGTKFDKAELHMTCSCPFWRWQGPEHWGKTEDYLYGKPRGTASFPKIRDPNHEKGACKHAYAVFQLLKTYRYVRQKKGSDFGFLSRIAQQGVVSVSYEGLDRLVRSVVRRYLRGESDAHL